MGRRRWRLNVKRLLVGGAVIGLIACIVGVSMSLASLTPGARGAASLRNAIPADDELANTDRVSGWPRQWLEAVCRPPLYQLHDYPRLPNATSTASCQSLVEYAGGVSDLVIARFPSELPMQVDLGNERYSSYSFAHHAGGLFVVATASNATVPGIGGSPYLLPLRAFGFSVYAGPGPP